MYNFGDYLSRINYYYSYSYVLAEYEAKSAPDDGRLHSALAIQLTYFFEFPVRNDKSVRKRLSHFLSVLIQKSDRRFDEFRQNNVEKQIPLD